MRVRELFVLAVGLKLLLVYSYFSTDFEVHRNWMAITNTLPIRKWYFDTTSEWTLDYPPLFAYFEWILSFFAKRFDSKIVELNNLDYAAISCIIFQRATIILTDLVFLYAITR
eukprot:TRINITY_DN15336_c0_g1_i1.p1 TRINITY_DN15336_c0_g1~~TRINITY_DN15336_c0_g1_i1.p1  ORF type:complete len:113 (+),score=5.31 TRINITY_DN15336_c0_g1_i1:3-341(+)